MARFRPDLDRIMPRRRGGFSFYLPLQAGAGVA